MNELNITEVAKNMVKVLQEGGTQVQDIEEVVVSVKLADGTKIEKRVSGANVFLLQQEQKV